VVVMIELYRYEHKLGWHLDGWDDFELRLVISLAPFSFKRAKRVIILGKHASLGLTPQAKHYMREASAQLRWQWSSCFHEPIPGNVQINAAIRSYLPTRRKTDSSNLYQGPEDVMQCCTPRCKPGCDRHAGVIVDDHQIRTHNGSDRLFDRENPRVEIVLTPYVARDARLNVIGA
jgi:hypothetical protein